MCFKVPSKRVLDLSPQWMPLFSIAEQEPVFATLGVLKAALSKGQTARDHHLQLFRSDSSACANTKGSSFLHFQLKTTLACSRLTPDVTRSRFWSVLDGVNRKV